MAIYIMKKLRLKLKACHIAMALMFLGILPLFTSCVDGDNVWNPVPPYGWDNAFSDPMLDGRWRLVQANGRPVSPYDTNYLDFYGRGRGAYYYYRNGRLYGEDMAYFCQRSGGVSRYQINIQYEYGSPVTMSYWFTDSYSLWMQWSTSSGPVTYVYTPCDIIPYDNW